jgi:hypothetical protein
MTKASDNPFPSILLEDHVDPSAPADGFKRLFVDTDEKLKMIDHASLVTTFTTAAVGSVATDAIWDAAGDLAVGTGDDTAAKLTKGAAGGYLSMINAGVAWNSGTSFPASKATGDRYWRTDLGLEYYWDGTRWVTTQLFTFSFARSTSTDGSDSTPVQRSATWGTLYDMYLLNWVQSWYVVTTNDGSKYWTLTLAEGDTGTTISSFTTAAGSANTWTTVTTAVNAVFSNDKTTIQYNAAKTSTPGVLVSSALVSYRLIAT